VVRIRMKKMGRRHRPFYRICAIDCRSPRDGRVIEELGTYDPMIRETDARANLTGERIDYWLGVGAQPSDKCKVLIKKYGSNGTHLEARGVALERLAASKYKAPVVVASKLKPVEEAPAEESPAPEAPAEDAPAAEAPAAEAPAAEAPAEKAAAEKKTE
jgi:small subunit ribosomal protein S16